MNFLDTGRVYYNGQNEVMLGKVIKGMRKEVIIQTRIFVSMKGKGSPKKSAEASERLTRSMNASLQESLKALQTDYIDILQIHGAHSIDIIHHAEVMEFFSSAKKKGQIRACGFTSHDNQVELLKAANKSRFYDVIMVPYNHKGAYRHSKGGHYREWDQKALELEMKSAEKNRIGIVAMKTCSGGPYSPNGNSRPSYKEALKWVLNHSFISTMAVAMGNVKEINENVQAMV
jgi:aryl-alcohol dehydrogenase-like predicted oxidoreductase